MSTLRPIATALLLIVSTLTPLAAADPVGDTVDRTTHLAEEVQGQGLRTLDEADDLQGPAEEVKRDVEDLAGDTLQDPPSPDPSDPGGAVQAILNAVDTARDEAVIFADNVRDAAVIFADEVRDDAVRAVDNLRDNAVKAVDRFRDEAVRAVDRARDETMILADRTRDDAVTHAAKAKNRATRSVGGAKNDALRQTDEAKDQALRSTVAIAAGARGWAGATTGEALAAGGPGADLALDVAELVLLSVAEPCDEGWRLQGGPCVPTPVTYNPDDDGPTVPTGSQEAQASASSTDGPNGFYPVLADKKCGDGKFGYVLRARDGSLDKGCHRIGSDPVVLTETVHMRDGGTVEISLTADRDEGWATLEIDEQATELVAVRLTIGDSALEYHYLDGRGAWAFHPSGIRATLRGIEFDGAVACGTGTCPVIKNIYSTPSLGPRMDLTWKTTQGLPPDTTRFYLEPDIDVNEHYGVETGELHSASGISDDAKGFNPENFEALLDLRSSSDTGTVVVEIPLVETPAWEDGHRVTLEKVSLAIHLPQNDGPMAFASVFEGTDVDLSYRTDGGEMELTGDLVFGGTVGEATLNLVGRQIQFTDLPNLRGFGLSTDPGFTCPNVAYPFSICTWADDVTQRGAGIRLDDPTLSVWSIPAGSFHAVIGPGDKVDVEFHPGDTDTGATVYGSGVGGLKVLYLAGVESLEFSKDGCGTQSTSFEADFTETAGDGSSTPWVWLWTGGSSGSGGSSDCGSDGGGDGDSLTLILGGVRKVRKAGGLHTWFWGSSTGWLVLDGSMNGGDVRIEGDDLLEAYIGSGSSVGDGPDFKLTHLRGQTGAWVEFDLDKDVDNFCGDTHVHLDGKVRHTEELNRWYVEADLDIDGPCGAEQEETYLDWDHWWYDPSWGYNPEGVPGGDVAWFEIECYTCG